MAKSSLSDYLPLLNQQIVSQELLSEYLLQVEAMFDVAFCGDLLAHKKATVHHYLSSMHGIVNQAREFNEQQLNNLISVTCLIKTKTPPDGEIVH